MSVHPPLALVGLLLLAAALGCQEKPEAEIFPAQAAPGSTAVVRAEGLDAEREKEAVRVRVGDQPALVIRVVPGVGVEFLVPELQPGPAAVKVEAYGKAAATATLTIVPPPARQLVLGMTGDLVELVSDRGAASFARPSREVPVRRGLAYDVLNAQGVLVATGVIEHPRAGRLEVHDEEGGLRGAPEPDSATFTLRIPAVPGGGTLRLYDVEPQIDVMTDEGRAERRLVSEIELGGGS